MLFAAYNSRQPYSKMSSDGLLRLVADRGSLTQEAQQALDEELDKRGLGTQDARRQYETAQDEQVTRSELLEKDMPAARSWIVQYVEQHPVATVLISLLSPVIAALLFFTVGKLMIMQKVGNGRILAFLVLFPLAVGSICGVSIARSKTRLVLKAAGSIGALITVPLALLFLWGATLGFE